MNNKIEVLCPAGDIDSVIAAVQNGADAVYLGQKDFSARQNAKNFDQDDLRKAVSYCHARGVFVYLAMNILVHDTQLNEVCDSIKLACDAGVDALIVQDLGIVSMIKEISKTMPIHASTQMAVHTVKGAELLKELGITRVVLARELTFQEMKEIAQNVQIETEVFVHGALCMSVSGQCYMSAMIGTRSGNRGNCAGTCRLPFTSNGSQNAYDLSLKDMCLANSIKDLQAAGITSIKIEGRMKRPEYVAVTAKAYDDARNGIEPDLETVQAVFSRNGFTDGYFKNEVNSDMFGFRQKEDVVSATTKVLKSIENTYKKEHGRIAIDMHVKAVACEPLCLTVTDCDNHTITVYGSNPEIAINTQMTEESLSRSLSKLGGTPFYLNKLTAELGEGLIAPASALNELRRNACEQLLEIRSEVKSIPCKNELRSLPQGLTQTDVLRYRARFARVEQVLFDDMNLFEFIILPIDEIMNHMDKLSVYKDKIIIEPHRVMFLSEESQFEKLSELKKAGYQHVLADNLAHIKMAQEFGLTIHSGNYINCFNSLSAQKLAELGAKDITLTFELELSKATKIKSPVQTGVIAYGYLPLMIMKNCPIKAKKSCKECGGRSHLTDRMGIQFRVICNNHQYSEVLNSSKLYMADRINELKNMSFATFYFTTEDKTECRRVINQYQGHDAPTGQFTRGLYYRSV